MYRIFAYTHDTWFEKYTLKFTKLLITKAYHLMGQVYSQPWSRKFKRNYYKVMTDCIQRYEPCVSEEKLKEPCLITKLMQEAKKVPFEIFDEESSTFSFLNGTT